MTQGRCVRICGALGLYFAILFLCPDPAHAKWRRPNEIFFGTAYTLPEDRMRIGVFAPLSYGVHDRITLSIHPILALLLTPNLSIRAKVIDGRVTVSAAAAYTQSFYVDSNEAARGQTRFYGIATLPFTDRFIVSASSGFAQDLAGGAKDFENTLSAHYRFDQRNIFMIQGGVANPLQSNEDIRFRGLLLYALAFDDFKAGAGAAFGEMPKSFGTITLDDNDLRVVPYVDVWWTF